VQVRGRIFVKAGCLGVLAALDWSMPLSHVLRSEPRGADAIAAEALNRGPSNTTLHSGGGLCVSRWMPHWSEAESGGRSTPPAPVCSGPITVTAASVPRWWSAKDVPPPPVHALQSDGTLSTGTVPMGSCGVVVTRAAPAVFSLDGTSKMAFHFFTETAAGWLGAASGSGGLGFLRVHAWVQPRSQPEFLHWLHLFTNSCHRSLAELRDMWPQNTRTSSAAHYGNSSNASVSFARTHPVCYSRRGRLTADIKAAAVLNQVPRTSGVTSPQQLFGLLDPELVLIDQASGDLMGPSYVQVRELLV
jgi:hypothetical protein